MNGNIYYVYAYLRAKDSANGKAGTPYYIGKGSKKRVRSTNRYLTVPRDNTFISFPAENMFEKDALQLEMLLIYLYGRIDLGTGCLRNLTDGGDGTSGAIVKPKSEETLIKMRNASLGKKHTEKTKLKIREANLGQTRKSNAGWIGHTVTEETRNKIRNTLSGRKRPPEVIAKMSSKRKGQPWSLKMRESIAKVHLSKRLSRTTQGQQVSLAFPISQS